MSVATFTYRRAEHVDAGWLRGIIETEMARRGPPPSRSPDRSGLAILLDEIAAAGILSHTAAEKLVYDIRAGRQRYVRVEQADAVLQSLDLPHLWHSE